MTLPLLSKAGVFFDSDHHIVRSTTAFMHSILALKSILCKDVNASSYANLISCVTVLKRVRMH